MTIKEGYKQAQAAKCKRPCLDYPYLGIPDDSEDTVDNIENPH